MSLDVDQLVAEFLAKGGKVEQLEKYARTPLDDISYTHGWGKKKKKAVLQPMPAKDRSTKLD
jgi:hypothetical protein